MTGTFLGAAIIGRPADRYGRRLFARVLLLPLLPLLAIPFFTDRIDVLIVVQVVLGLLIGADQPISQAYVTETSTDSNRHRRLSSLMFIWYVGALIAIGIMSLLTEIGFSWRGFYLLPLILTSFVAIARYRVEETPFWKPTLSITQRHKIDSLFPTHARTFGFCCSFWLCQTIPVTALLFFSPIILSNIAGSTNQINRIALIYSLFLIGTLPMTLMKRRQQAHRILKFTAVAMAISLAVVALFGNSSPLVLSLAFGTYAFAYGMQTTLDNLYPNILFPTQVRAHAVGIILAVSRIGSAFSAFIFPFLMAQFSLTSIFLGGALVALLSYVSIIFLPKKQRDF